MSQHPAAIAIIAALMGFGSSVAYGWVKGPSDVTAAAIIATKVEDLQGDMQRLTIAIENQSKRIDALLDDRRNHARSPRR